jgi:hypothetical protein
LQLLSHTAPFAMPTEASELLGILGAYAWAD